MSGCMALSVTAVSISVSPLRIEDEDTDMFMTSAPSRLPASSNEDWVRVEASKNRLTWVRPRRLVRFLSTWRLSSTYSSERSSRPVMSAAESPSIPSRCRGPRTKGDFDAGVIKTRAIGGDGWLGKRESGPCGFSPGLSGGGVKRGPYGRRAGWRGRWNAEFYADFHGCAAGRCIGSHGSHRAKPAV